jgi:hypothetical protein
MPSGCTHRALADAPSCSSWILTAGLPQLDRIAFGIADLGEATIGIDFRVDVDGDALPL